MCLGACATAGVAHEDPPTGAGRTEACGEGRGVADLRETLNDVARELSRGTKLRDAIDALDYPVANAQSVYMKGPTDDAAIEQLIEDRYCTAANDVRFTEVGVYRKGDEAWIVLASRPDLPAIEDSAAIAARVLDLVNAARSAPRRCGSKPFGVARPLTLSPALTEAASLHSRDMAQHATLDHRGSDGSESAERVSRVGYRWRAVGENIASGQSSAETVVAGWIESAGHCANIMGPQFTQMGVAFALAPSDHSAIYWTQVFAAPQ